MENKGVLVILFFLFVLGLLFLLFRLMVFAMNGEKGLDYYITRAEITGDGNRIVRDSGRFRALQPAIEILLCAVLLLGIGGFVTGDTTEPIMAWLRRYGPWASLSLLILLAAIMMTVRLHIARQMRDNPLDINMLPTEKEYTVVGTRHPKRVQLLSALSGIFFFLSLLWCIGLTSEYVSHSLMLFFLLLSLGFMVFALWTAHRERRNFVQIMIIDCSGIRLAGNTRGPKGFVPWKDITRVIPGDNRLRIFIGTDAPDKTIEVIPENSLIRCKTIAMIADQYRLKANQDSQGTTLC